MKRNKRKNKKKRKSTNSGSSSDKRQRLSGYASEIIESGESEASSEISAGETKESDCDRRGREKKEREQKKREEAAERKRQGHAKQAAIRSKPCIANIGGIRVEKNGITTFEGGTDFGPYSEQTNSRGCDWYLEEYYYQAISKKGSKSRGKKGVGSKVKRSCLSMHLSIHRTESIASTVISISVAKGT